MTYRDGHRWAYQVWTTWLRLCALAERRRRHAPARGPRENVRPDLRFHDARKAQQHLRLSAESRDRSLRDVPREVVDRARRTALADHRRWLMRNPCACDVCAAAAAGATKAA